MVRLKLKGTEVMPSEMMSDKGLFKVVPKNHKYFPNLAIIQSRGLEDSEYTTSGSYLVKSVDNSKSFSLVGSSITYESGRTSWSFMFKSRGEALEYFLALNSFKCSEPIIESTYVVRSVDTDNSEVCKLRVSKKVRLFRSKNYLITCSKEKASSIEVGESIKVAEFNNVVIIINEESL